MLFATFAVLGLRLAPVRPPMHVARTSAAVMDIGQPEVQECLLQWEEDEVPCRPP